MYNGIGLQTPRGSGTNGHVQRNFALVRKTKDKVNYKTEEEIAKLDNSSNKQPNREILDHERKRKIELKCAELEDILEQQGFSNREVEEQVSEYRIKLMDGDALDKPDKDSFGRVIVGETHQLAAAQQEKNARLREAFGISSSFVDGSSLRGGSKQGPQQQYLPIRTPTPEPPAKKKKQTHSTSSPQAKKDKKKKSKKSKKERSGTSKKEKKKKRSRSSDSSSSSDGNSDSDSESEKEEKRNKKKKRASRQSSERDKSSDSSPENNIKNKPAKQTLDIGELRNKDKYKRSPGPDILGKNTHRDSPGRKLSKKQDRYEPKSPKSSKDKHRSKSPECYKESHTPDKTSKYSNNRDDKYKKYHYEPAHGRRNLSPVRRNVSPARRNLSPRRNREKYRKSPPTRGYSSTGRRDRSRSPSYKRRDRYYTSPERSKDKVASHRERSRSPRKSRPSPEKYKNLSPVRKSSSPKRKPHSQSPKRKRRIPSPKRRIHSPSPKRKARSPSPRRKNSNHSPKARNRSISPKSKNYSRSPKSHSPSPKRSKINKPSKMSRSITPKTKRTAKTNSKEHSPVSVYISKSKCGTSRTPESSPPPKANKSEEERSLTCKLSQDDKPAHAVTEINGNFYNDNKSKEKESKSNVSLNSENIHNIELPKEMDTKKDDDNTSGPAEDKSKDDKEKQSPSTKSRSSSSLSYSPARRSPERYKDVLDKLSDKDKSKYLKPNGKDKNKHTFHDGRKSILLTTIPVVRLHPSSSDEETDDRPLDDEDDPQAKELDLLKIDLAFIAKESVKKRMEQRERDAATSSNQGLDKPSTSTNGEIFVSESSQQNIATNEITQEEIDREKDKLELEAKKRRLQTPDKSCSPSPVRSNSRYSSSSSSSSASSRYSGRKYSSTSSRGSAVRRSSSSTSFSRSSRSSRSSHSASSRSHTSRSRSPSIPRRAGSPSFLDRRRITSARKRPIPYRRPTPSTHSSSSEWSSHSPSPRRHSTTISPNKSPSPSTKTTD